MFDWVRDDLERLEDSLDRAESSGDRISWKEFFDHLRAYQQQLSAAQLPTAERREAQDRAQGLYMRAQALRDQRREVARERLEVALQTITELEQVIEDIGDLDAWRHLDALGREARGHLEAASEAPREERQQLWDRLNAVRERARELRAEHDGRTEDAIVEYEMAIAQAEGRIRPWREVYALRSDVRGLFKSCRFSSQARQQEYWEKFQEAEQQLERQQQVRDYNSESYKHEIIGMLPVLDAGVVGGMLELTAHMMTAGSFQQSQKEELQGATESHREAWRRFREVSDDMRREDRDEVRSALDDIKEKLDEAWQEYRRDGLTRAVDGKRAYCDRLRKNIEDKEDYIERVRDQIDNARTESFREGAEERLETAQEQLDELRDKLERAEEELSELEGKLDEII